MLFILLFFAQAKLAASSKNLSPTTEPPRDAAAHAPTVAGSMQDRMYRLAGLNPIKSQSEILRQITLHPKSSELYLQLGQSYFEDGDADQALNSFNHALSVDPKCVQAHIGISRVMIGLGKTKEGLAQLKIAVKEGNKDVATSALWECAFDYRELRQYEESLACYDQAIKQGLVGNEKQSFALAQRGELYMRTNRDASALSDFNGALKLMPDDILFHRLRATCLMHLGKWKEALGDVNTAINAMKTKGVFANGLANERYQVVAQRADVYRHLGMEAEAARDEMQVRALKEDQYKAIPFRSDLR